MEESIAQKEANYLDATPNGNIIIGFDSYIKGINAASQRKKQNAPDANRVFSRSSVSYRPTANEVCIQPTWQPARTKRKTY